MANAEKNEERFSNKIREKHQGGVWKILNYWEGIGSDIIRDKHKGEITVRE